MDSRRRSLAKALSWRVIALAVTASVAFALSRDASVALSIGLLDSLIKIFAYYGHERAWLRVAARDAATRDVGQDVGRVAVA